MFGRCYEIAIKLHFQHEGSKILQVSDYLCAPSKWCDSKWLDIPPSLWVHYVVLIKGMIYDLTAEQFGLDEQIYSKKELKERWGKIHCLD